MKKFFKAHSKEIIATTVAVLSFFLICCAIVLVRDYTNGLDRQAEDSAKVYSDKYRIMINNAVSDLVAATQRIAAGLPSGSNVTSDYLSDLMQTENREMCYVHYALDGKEWDATGNQVHQSSPYIQKIIREGQLAITGFINDSFSGVSGCAVYVPAPRSAEAEGLLIFYYTDALLSRLDMEEADADFPEFLGVCNAKGDVFSVLYKRDFAIEKHENFFVRLRALSNDKATVDAIEKSVKENRASCISLQGEKNIVSFDCADDSSGMLYVVSVYKAAAVYAEGFQLTSTIYASIITLSIIIVLLLVYIVVVKLKDINKTDDFNTIDAELGCPTYKKFDAQAAMLLAKNKITRFAVIYTEVAHFNYIEENFGKDVATDALKFLARLYEKSLLTDECFCRIEDAKFALLFHYSDESTLFDRINVLSTIFYNCPILVEKEYNMKLRIGIYFIEREKNLPINKMLANAESAEKSNASVKVGNLKIYDPKIHEIFLHEAEIELKMERSLKNNEFKVFFQPKYNIAQNRIDGAEALIRWFDPESHRFRSPAEFIDLFEANGFIANVDKFVLVEVCKYLKEATERGYKVVPVSINVSRVTAIQKDFLSFYINNKRKYGIADGFIWIEFTESFAYENYDKLQKLVHSLHENGFKCSIDDFGSGYASFNILKSLPMDELKLDRMFLEAGVSKERDEKLLQAVIALAKSLDMKVTQEGIEEREDFARIKAYGCDVVQGYIYSKPLPMTDYVHFVNESGLRLC